MSDINFQNGFLVGTLINSILKPIDTPVPVSIYNGAGIYWSTYVVIVFNFPLEETEMKKNIEAFAITGTELDVPKNYAVEDVELMDAYRIGVKCADFRDVDDFLTISYVQESGNLEGRSGKLVQTFTQSFAPTYVLPKIFVRMTYTPLSVAFQPPAIALAALTENLTVVAQEPTDASITEVFSPISINFSPSVSLGTFTENASCELNPT